MSYFADTDGDGYSDYYDEDIDDDNDNGIKGLEYNPLFSDFYLYRKCVCTSAYFSQGLLF